MKERHIVVLGGGITGLVAALRLRQQADQSGVPCQLTLVEGEQHWGGKIRTVREDGFVVEGGPDAFVTGKPWALRLCEELGLTERLLPTNPSARSVFVLWHDRLHPLPQGFLAFAPDWRGLLTTELLSWRGKLRVAFGATLPPLRWQGDVSVGAFFRYHFGSEMVERVIAPLLAGVYGGDGERLSARMTLPTLWQVAQTHRNLVWASLLRHLRQRLNKDAPAHPPTRFLTLTGGLGELVEALVRRLEESAGKEGQGAQTRLLKGRKAIALRREAGGKFTVMLEGGEGLVADAAIIAIPAPAAAQLLRPCDEKLAAELATIPHADAITVSLAFDRTQVRHPLNGSGFLVVPERGDERWLMACTWTSSKFPPRAPKGKVLLRAFANRWMDGDDEAIVGAIVDELRSVLGIEGMPERAWVFRWRQAMPQYTVGHEERLARVQQHLQRWQRLALAGNYLTGIGIPDCIRSGTEAAQRVWQSLGRDE